MSRITPPTDGLVRHQLSDAPVIATSPIPVPTILAPPPQVKPTPPRPDRFSRDSYGNPRPVSRFSVDSDFTNGHSPIRSPPDQTPPRRITTLPEDDDEEDSASSTAAPSSHTSTSKSLAPSLPVLNLPSESFSIDTSDMKTPPLSQERIPDVPLETRSTLAALSRQDPLERRASRRFSSYNFSKMLPGSPSSKKLSSPQRPTRRAAPPPMPPLPETRGSISTDEGSVVRRHLDANGSFDDNRVPPPRTPSPRPDSDSSGPDPDSSMRIVPTPNATPTPSVPAPLPTSVSIFLQIGRQVKKTNVELPTNLSSIKLLFMERFEYDPGKEDFPEVYIRDYKTGVQFELEDMDDLREGTVLSLNIERECSGSTVVRCDNTLTCAALDQVKQHFDLTVGSLMQEIKEMKSSLDHTRRMSMAPSAAMMSLSPSMSVTKAMPKPEPLRLSPSITSLEASPLPVPSSSSIVLTNEKRLELQTQHDEIVSLRRDLAVMRQVHVDFLAETKESFGKLRTQNSAMREVVKTKMGGSRALLDNSKAKMETQCQEAIQAVEEISDIIDNAREDAYKRFVTPSAKQISNIKQSLENATNFVDQFSRDVTLADPTWRSTWASELKRVQEEQGLLSHQRKLAADLKNDIKDAAGMFGAVQEFVNQRASGARVGSNRGYRPPSPDTTPGSGGIPNLLMEIRTKEADPHQRLRAIEAQRKAREKELMDRSTDEFQSELGTFVNGRKLKKTGGHEEVERVRARRNDNTLKKMLTGDTGDQGVGVLSPQVTGMSMLSAQHTGASMLSAQHTGTSTSASILSSQHTGPATPSMTAQHTGASSLTPQMTGGSVVSPSLAGSVGGSTTGNAAGHRLSGSSTGVSAASGASTISTSADISSRTEPSE